MAKYRVVQRGSLVTVKSKLSRKDAVNEREIDYLMRNYMQGLFRISYDGKRTIEYTAPMAVPLKKYLKNRMLEEHTFWMLIVQIIERVREIEMLGLHPSNLWMDMDALFINETSAELYCLYRPLSSVATSGTAFAVINDITYTEIKKNIGTQSRYLEEFRDFLCSENSYRLENIEAYIAGVYPEIYKAVGNPDRGKSGFLTADRSTYQEHYAKRVKPHQKSEVGGTVCLIEEDDEVGGTVCLNEDEYDECGTVVLDVEEEDCGATTVLAVEEKKEAVLIHLKDGVRKAISTDSFSIGKSNVNDYCMKDNSAVSRKHATIVHRDDAFYLLDCESTNGTFLNDKRIQSGEEMLLEDGDKIVLADEEFEIEIR